MCQAYEERSKGGNAERGMKSCPRIGQQSVRRRNRYACMAQRVRIEISSGVHAIDSRPQRQMGSALRRRLREYGS
eukprot:scaffold27296_cov35-Phaeocystis_antarctica.AAC.1